MRKEQASSTALLIAAGLVLLHRDPDYRGIISRSSAELGSRILDLYSWRTRLLSKILRCRWFQLIAATVEHFTVPGILQHYALRKRCLALVARDALSKGVRQIVVLGAGFDPLAFDLHREFVSARFWEIDHPATQQFKSSILTEIDSQRFHLIAADLSSEFPQTTLVQNGFDSTQPSFWMAEGLLMYLPANVVLRLIAAVGNLSGRGSAFAFTFMEKRADGRIRFRTQTKLVDWWLSRRGEPFVWGLERNQISQFIRPWRVVRIFDETDLRALDSSSPDRALAAGELICLAEIT